jgi:two-component system sensor histidine kinase GlrK
VLNQTWLKSLSIKQLTVLGFTLVALPLVFSLLYSAVKINHLSTQGSEAIFDVAQLIKTNRELNATRIKMERFASQYLVLNDEELLSQYQEQNRLMPNILNVYIQNNANKNKQTRLAILGYEFLAQSEKIAALMVNNHGDKPSLAILQQHFVQLANIHEKINMRSNELINQHANKITSAAEQVSFTLLRSLLIIPIVICIAIVFIRLITKPLKLLTHKIHQLELGKLTNKISVQGSIEITEIADALELMRTRLHALELQKSSFIRHISHELKTPLAAIREGAELLYDHSVGELNPEQQEISEIIRASVSRLQKLIEDLLDFNVVLDSTSLQDAEKLSLAVEINNAIATRKLDIKRKKLQFEHNVTDIALYSNAKQLNVILDNLLSNAIKYSPHAGTICIDGHINNDELHLSISDQGSGIAVEQQEKVFDAFYQGTPPTDSNIKGSGLGLTIVKELIMRLGGEISLKSQTSAPTGTTVTIILPRALSQS